ncbi:hypothetical protein FDP41_005307 [Naegleria fowleri]|uniref:Guanylate cyclase domain-containing protein n=1 Tax=Naegleria fowleri TaxID=5763 RepID=A0A6A5BQ04_NAEFO|nr:uncharacterized protein FDP41_005307 [Naegleria fowleri]KAF0975980.1 hypothetical protein FDP41_005307 [Naegleria fowleri]CAG4710370.1 unnamed protein product [Naegleria fowleri]
MAPKISPVTTHESSSPLETDEVDLLSHGHNKTQRSKFMSFCLSVRLFLIIVITSVVLLTAVSIWLTSFVVNETYAMKSVNVIIDNINNKVVSFLSSQLLPAKQVAEEVANNYHYSYIDVVDSIRYYLFSKMKTFQITLVNLALAENGLNQLQALTWGLDASTQSMELVYAKKMPGENFLTYVLNKETGVIDRPYFLNLTKYPIAYVDYYIESKQLFKKYPNGAFGSVYQVINSSLQTFWTTPVYNRTDLSKKQRIGIAKVNIGLDMIAMFLSSLKVLDRGYIVLSEYESGYVIGSSLEIADFQYKRVNASDISTRNAGTIMKQVIETQVETVQFSTTVNGVSYLVSSSPFQFYNLKWRLTLVFEENEIKEGIIMSSYIMIGVTCAVALLGVTISIVVGYIVTKPLSKLQQDFKKIEILDLSNIKPRTSFFSEAKSIYSSLTDTVAWLSEFRAFLPDSVLNQLHRGMSTDESKDAMPNVANNKSQANLSESASMASRSQASESKVGESALHMNTTSGHTSSLNSHNMFKLGLSDKHCCVLHIHVANLEEEFQDSEELTSTISKLLTGVSTICKTVRADLQIKSYCEYSIIFADKPNGVIQMGLDTTLKILTALSHINATLVKNSHQPLRVGIGVASGVCAQGNVGNRQMRYFALVGPVVKRAKDLSLIALELGIPTAVDKASYALEKDNFIFRPVERYLQDNSISTVYELRSRNQISNEEWLYELQQVKNNSKYTEYAQYFDKLFEEGENDQAETGKNMKDFIGQFLMKYPDDKSDASY